MVQENPFVIIGGNHPTGAPLIRRLSEAGYTAEVISRHPLSVPDGFVMTPMDLTLARNWIAPVDATIISLLPLWVLAKFLPRFMGVKSIIAVSSNLRYNGEIFTTTEPYENALRQWAEKSNVQWTLLRSTIIYNGLNDNSITRMARFIKRWRFLPVVPPCSGRRQPMHADDAAKTVVSSLTNPATANRTINIGGGEVVTYHEMTLRIFAALKQRPHLIPMPTGLLYRTVQAGMNLGMFNETAAGAAALRHMNDDLLLDIDEGLALLDYQPRAFNPTFPELV